LGTSSSGKEVSSQEEIAILLFRTQYAGETCAASPAIEHIVIGSTGRKKLFFFEINHIIY
jgi:hypothetical protein